MNEQTVAGRETAEHVVRTEVLTGGPAHALAGLIEVPEPAPGSGLPPLWHWVYLLDRPPRSAQGPDGHPVTGVPRPPGPGRRRMWAGGRVRRLDRLLVGEEATRRTFVRRSVDKQGSTGPLTFVTVAHEISQGGRVVVDEEQDLVYRAATAAGPGAPESAEVVPPEGEERRIVVDPVLLFRYSALTYNGHRIHYDRDYARDVEGYAGLVVHGPLQALLMAEAARARRPEVTAVEFDYRLVSPLIDHQGLVVSAVAGEDGALVTRARDDSGRTTATGIWRPLASA
ncbi:MaoC family dehydratase N-terminal domain-containing protein [Amycolatopsis sp. NPDC047767]|uniref:FAS1-like dehydratase domain-containing protein n=1 Tax=Amycolatopsis sp. NPDC047767 TaxID=3156765 RepID=UPI0034514916